jgi:hypothetical protein
MVKAVQRAALALFGYYVNESATDVVALGRLGWNKSEFYCLGPLHPPVVALLGNLGKDSAP